MGGPELATRLSPLPNGLVPGALEIGPEGYGGYGDASGNTSTVFAADVHPVIRALKELHGRLAEGHAANLCARATQSAVALPPDAPLPSP